MGVGAVGPWLASARGRCGPRVAPGFCRATVMGAGSCCIHFWHGPVGAAVDAPGPWELKA